ncbi:MAG: hypothetical protein LH606_01515 [Cytophagaceae bacterium]|nr:hypothetical protein [Cytophagaceae bacterium]
MKRSFLTRLTCLWLAATVLLASSGFTVVEHVCQMRGKVSRVQLTPKGCTTHCSQQKHHRSGKQPNVHKQSCCQVAAHYQHLETVQVITTSPVAFPKSATDADLVITSLFLLAALWSPASDNPLPVESTAPLNSSGRDRLVQFCTWLI